MLKYLFSIILSVFILFNLSYGQEIKVENIPSHGYQGVKSIEGQMFYTFNPVYGSFTDYTLTLIDKDLKFQKTHTLKFGRLVEVEAVATNDNKFLFYISSDKVGHLYMFDQTGNEIKHTEINAPNNNLNTAEIFAYEGGFCMVRPDKEKKAGFVVSRLDAQLNTKWEKKYFDEKMKFKVATSAIGKENISILYMNKKDPELVSLKLADGTEVFKKSISHEKVKSEPTHMSVADNGTIGIVGKYTEQAAVKSSIETYKYFFQSLDKNGNELSFNAENWSEKQINKVKTNSTVKAYSDAGNPNLYIHSLLPTTDGFSVIAESFVHYSSAKKKNVADMTAISGSPAYLYCMDIILMNFDQQGNIKAIKKIAKPTKRTETTGMINTYSPETAADYLLDYGRFSYRYTSTDKQGNPSIVIFNQNHNQKYVGFLGLNDTYEDIFKRDYIEETLTNPSGSGEMSNEKYVHQSLKIDNVKENGKLNYTDILPASGDYYILSSYKDKTITLEKRMKSPTPNPLDQKGVFGTPTVGEFLNGGYYTLYRSESGQNGNTLYALQFTDVNGKLLNSHALSINGNYRFNRTAKQEGVFKLYYRNNTIGEDMVMAFDTKAKQIYGKKLSTIVEKEERIGGVDYVFNGVGMVRSTYLIKDKNQKFTLSYFDKEDNLKWTKVYDNAPVGQTKYRLLSLTNEEINVTKTITTGIGDLKDVMKFIVGINLTGEVQTEEKIYHNNTGGIYEPSVYGSYQNGTSNYMAGLNYIPKNLKYSANGIFFHNTDQNFLGKVTLLDWDKVSEIMEKPDLKEKIKEGVIRFKLSDIVRLSGGIALVTEVVQYEEKGSIFGTYVTGNGILSNFMVFIFNPDGTYKEAFSIHKEPLNLTGLRCSKPISYQRIVGAKDVNYIMYTNIGDDLKLYLYRTPCAKIVDRKQDVVSVELEKEMVANTTQKTKLEELEARINKMNNDWENLLKKPEPPAYKEDRNTDYVPSTAQHVFVHRYNQAKAQLKFEMRQF